MQWVDGANQPRHLTMNTTNPAPLDRDLNNPDAPLVCDTSARFVRVIGHRPDGLVAFEFSIGWPELAVELLLPAKAYVEFCATHKVQLLPPAPGH